MRRLLSAVLGCLLLFGCANRAVPPLAPQQSVTNPAPTGLAGARASAASPAPAQGSESGVATLYFVQDEQLWRFEVAQRKATPMGVAASCQGAGEVDVGSDQPILSPSGRHIAHLAAGRLFLTDVRTNASRAVTLPGEAGRGKPANLQILLSGWSPDGRYLIFHVAEAIADEAAEEARASVDAASLGFMLLDSTELSVRRLPGLPGFVTWAPDRRRVLVERSAPSGNQAIFYVEPDGSNPTLGRETKAAGGFAQLRLSGDQAAWIDGLHVAVGPMGSGDSIAATPDGTFADYQWPSLSPDKKHLAYTHRLRSEAGAPVSELVVADRAGGSPRPLRECGGSCYYQWSGPDRLVLVQAEGIFYLDLDGNSVNIAGPGSAFVFVGQN